jgi:hypothetical protein
MDTKKDSNTPRLVLRMAGLAKQTLELFALKVERLDPDGKGRNVSIAEVK